MSKTNPFILSDKNPAHQNVLKRKGSEIRFKLYGLFAICISIAFLAFLLGDICSKGYTSFEKTVIKIRLNLSPELKDENLDATIDNISELNFRKIVSDSLKDRFPEATDRNQILQMNELISRDAYIVAKNRTLDKFRKKGQLDNIILWVPASSKIDMYIKNKIDTSVDESMRKVSDFQIQMVQKLKFEDSIKKVFNGDFLKKSDSREPESAGIYGAFTGSCYVMLLCMLIALPIGIGAAIYLEEFAPASRIKTVIEISINNLAAVPSIVYGLLGLAVFINFVGVPRSSAIAGGLTLALLILPIIIVSTRNSIAAVPPSIRDGAIALGASKIQTVFHHVLPLSLPGIMTGSILSMARAVGETAPLLLIGMVAFVRDVPHKITDPATVLPVQIFLWSDLPEQGFVEKTSGAIIILLLFLIIANGLAVYLRRKFEYKW